MSPLKSPLTWAMVVLAFTPLSFAEETGIESSGKGIICRADEQPLFEYLFKDVTFKPYVSRLWTPSGVNILRDSPHDHVHHHALMLAVNVDDFEFWAETPNSTPPPGSQVTQSVIVVKDTDSGSSGVQSKLHWITGDNQLVMREKRMVRARQADDVTLLTWESVLTSAGGQGPFQLTGRHYHGLGMRFVEPMDHEGHFLTPKGNMGDIIRGDERNTQCKWCAYSAKVDGKPVTVAIFDHPDNIRPMVAFTMGDSGAHFAYLAATLNLWKEPLEVPADQPLTLRWGVAVWDAEVDSEQTETVYKKWVEGTK